MVSRSPVLPPGSKKARDGGAALPMGLNRGEPKPPDTLASLTPPVTQLGANLKTPSFSEQESSRRRVPGFST